MSQRKGHPLTGQHPPAGLVLHVAWSPDGYLGLWGESVALAATAPAKPAKSNQGQPARHPFACRAEDLQALGGAALTAGKPGVLRLWLPSARDGPRPSPGCAPTAGTSPPAAATRAAWQVPAIMLMPADVWPLLDWLHANPANVTAGPSLRYLHLIAQAVLHMAVQGELLPRLEAVAGGVQAAWRPAPAAAATLPARLSGHLPASLLAAHSPGNAQSPPPADLLARLVDALADAFARRSAKQALATVPSTVPAGDRVAATWLTALAADEATVTASAKSLRSLATSLGTWPEATPPAVPTEPLSLHLVPPSPQAPANTPWRLEFVQTGAGPGSPQGGRPSMKVLWRAAKAYPPLNRAIEAQ